MAASHTGAVDDGRQPDLGSVSSATPLGRSQPYASDTGTSGQWCHRSWCWHRPNCCRTVIATITSGLAALERVPTLPDRPLRRLGRSAVHTISCGQRSRRSRSRRSDFPIQRNVLLPGVQVQVRRCVVGFHLREGAAGGGSPVAGGRPRSRRRARVAGGCGTPQTACSRARWGRRGPAPRRRATRGCAGRTIPACAGSARGRGWPGR